MSKAKDSAKRALDNLQGDLGKASEDLRVLTERRAQTRDPAVKKIINRQVTVAQGHVNRLKTKVKNARKNWEKTS